MKHRRCATLPTPRHRIFGAPVTRRGRRDRHPLAAAIRFPATITACIRDGLPASISFPLQAHCAACRRPGIELHTGGEFVLTEQRPRMPVQDPKVRGRCSKATPVIFFAVRQRPVAGVRAATLPGQICAHGVSRFTLGIATHPLGLIFHDRRAEPRRVARPGACLK